MVPSENKVEVLIVEDENLIAADLEARLGLIGYTVSGKVESAEEALSFIEENPPDLVMMDIVPDGGRDGLEASEIIRDKWGIPLVFVTTHDDAARLERAGQTRPFGYILKPIQDKDLKTTVEMALYVARIDAQRRRAEEKWKRTEALLNATQRLSKVGGWEWDPKSEKMFWSDEVYRIHDFDTDQFDPDSEDLIAKSVNCYHPEDRGILLDAFQKCARDGTPYDLEFPFTTHKREAWIRTTAKAVFEKGEVLRVIGNIMDITNWKLTEEALRESEGFIRAIMDNLPIGVAVNSVDPEVNFNYINNNFIKFYRTTKEKLIDADAFWEAAYEDPEFREKMRKRVLDDCASGDPSRMIWEDVPIDRKGEETSYITAMNIPVPGKNLMISTVWDVTVRKRMEEEKKKLEAQLRHAQKMEAVGTLAGGISHDFNNLLQAINGYTQILLLDKNPDSPEYASLEAIQTAGERAADLVQQLLLFSRKAEAERKPSDLNHVVEQSGRLLERIIPKMIDIEFRLDSHLEPISADPVQMEQIILNLGQNATDAMPEGGRLCIETENIVLDEDFTQIIIGIEPGHYILLSVSDTGHGMTSDTVEHIFEPFFTTKEIGKGTGLGLASVYGIVKSHGGHITCYSEIGQGTVFRIYLPAIDRVEETPALKTEEESIPGGTERILLVDDEESIRDFASRVFLKYGYAVSTASSGEEALEIYAVAPNGIDLVILDIGMPGMGGHKCLRELIKINPTIKVVITSGYSVDGQMKETLEAGARSFVPKPYQLNKLLGTVRKVLDQKK